MERSYFEKLFQEVEHYSRVFSRVRQVKLDYCVAFHHIVQPVDAYLNLFAFHLLTFRTKKCH